MDNNLLTKLAHNKQFGKHPPMSRDCEKDLWVLVWNCEIAIASCSFVSKDRLAVTIIQNKEKVCTIGLNEIEVQIIPWYGKLTDLI